MIIYMYDNAPLLKACTGTRPGSEVTRSVMSYVKYYDNLRPQAREEITYLVNISNIYVDVLCLIRILVISIFNKTKSK